MNPNLEQLHPYPFERLKQLKEGINPPADKAHIALSIGEPKHPTPAFIYQALAEHKEGIAKYPTTKGVPELRETIARWISWRFGLPEGVVGAETQVIPVGGTREALFSIAQAVVDASSNPLVIMPNPFYQIYEGAAFLAGAEPYYLNTTEEGDYLPDFDSVPEAIWQRCQLIFICSPGNPTGAVISKESQQKLIALAEKYDFVIASDECYSEIYDDENNPPQGLLQTAYESGNTDFKRCIAFNSLSKRSNAPGLRSGFVAGDAKILQKYFQYRTYQGCALPLPTQYASIAAWADEAHVMQNRVLYREKFSTFVDIVSDVCTLSKPPASFYIWLKTSIDDAEFAQRLFQQENITVLPGRYLSRQAEGINPGKNHVRIALVASIEECIEAANRMKYFINTLD
ncbi:MAG: succinyldiaminopimelate transaminase [Methylococcales bacterium]|nr:succinyldiaminopimelate transaminase [Methylococcales bacterium]